MNITIKLDSAFSSCLLCSSSETKPYLYVGAWLYHMCLVCRSVFLPSSLLENQKSAHMNRDYKLSRLIVESQNYVHNDWLLNEMISVKSFGRLLEVGCGAGFFIKAAADYGYDVQGLDLGEENVIFGKSFLNVDICNRDFLELSDDRKFDWIVMHQLIEHVVNPREFICKVRSLLKPQGCVFITTPNLSFAKGLVKLFRLFGMQPPMNDALGHPPNHCVLFESYTLKKVLAEEGFQVIKYGHNPTAYKGQKSMSICGVVRRFVDRIIMQINVLRKSTKIIGPNMYFIAQVSG